MAGNFPGKLFWGCALVLAWGLFQPGWSQAHDAEAHGPGRYNGAFSWENRQLHFNLPALDQGQVCSDSSIGNITLCYFWTERNLSANSQIRALYEFWMQYRWLGIKLVGFCVDADPARALPMTQVETWQLACARLPSQIFMVPGSPVKGLPTLLILSPGGIIQKKYEGLLPLDKIEKDLLGIIR